jgi:NHL repeat
VVFALAFTAAAPAGTPRLIAGGPAEVGVRWTGVLAATSRPRVTARLGAARSRVTVTPMRRGRYRLRAVFRSPGRWVLLADGKRVGTVLVRTPGPRLTNAADVVVEPGGTLLVADLSNRVFRQAGGRLTLVAGNGRSGRTGDGGPAPRAAIGFPVEVAVDPGGGFGIVHGERWVRHVDSTGTIATVGDFGGATALAYDVAGNLWVSEIGGRVQRRDRVTGTLTTYTGFNQPHGLDAAADGTVYVCDTFNNRVQRIGTGGHVTTLADGLNLPVDLDVAPNGDVYVADFNGSRVLRITPAGTVSVAAAGVAGTNSVAVGADGAIYVTQRGRASIRRIPPG